jgi:hypothetical protein
MRIYPAEIVLGCFFNSFLVAGCIGVVLLLQPLARQLPIPGYIASPLVGGLGLWGGVLLMMTVAQIGTPFRDYIRLFLGLQVITLIILLSGLAALGTHYTLVGVIPDKRTLQWSAGLSGVFAFFTLMLLYCWYMEKQLKKK